MNTNKFGNTGGSFGQTGAQFGSTYAGMGGADSKISLRGKLTNLEELIKSVSEDMNFNIKEVQVLKSEKDTLEQVLIMKTQDVKKSLTNELNRIEEEMRRHFAHQKAENGRLQDQISKIKGEKTALTQQLLGLQKRITEVEIQIGAEEQ
ncbi:hypothetical protein PPERSA_00880 [Pseudocohnilembus persalinus]|uniref:Uncharacterized protein n=1 Tax=Pseudocohnilembus persalinus TaxID=266149 RepID=A0A0V0QEQ3_PSEPJ|nr:hypothetical protein PPERSA_00880 [Pseudocohnilembus persalinus]|eukprot:KRX00653.1 hypothetical protein PPERSA_00880 [Pseudocohnilembus persalinus]